MKKYLFILVFYLCGSLAFASSKPRFLNIIIVSDLSDRNLADKERLPKFPMKYDLSVIKELLNQFSMNVKRNLYINSRDRICFVYLPEYQSSSSNFNISDDNLEIDMNEIDIRSKRIKLNSITQMFYSKTKEIYSLALKQKTIGADIWAFFKYDLERYIIKQPSFRNILVILTDGYLYFDEDYKNKRLNTRNGATYMNVALLRNRKNTKNPLVKLLPINKDFSNLEILMMGIDPIIKYNNKEYSIILNTWSTWFNSMNVRNYKIVRLEKSKLSISLDIKNFFHSKK